MAWAPPPAVAGIGGRDTGQVVDEEAGRSARTPLTMTYADEPHERDEDHDRPGADDERGQPVHGGEPAEPVRRSTTVKSTTKTT